MLDAAKLQQEIDRCSKCGGCLAVCPVYQELKVETAVARGRVFLIGQHLEGKLELSPKAAEIMSLCLLCKSCVANCPNQVGVDRLVMSARRKIVAKHGLPIVKKTVFHYFLSSSGRLNLLAFWLRFYERWLRPLVLRSGLLHLISSLHEREQLLPRVAERPLRKQLPTIIQAAGSIRRVAYFTGCMTNYVFPQTGRALVEVLMENAVEVVIPEQVCCGVPAAASGDEDAARLLAHKNVLSFSDWQDVDAIVVDCPSCGAFLREYGEMLCTDEAKSFSAKVMDITQYLTQEITLKRPPGEMPLSVTYHDPCHAIRVLGLKKEPRDILKLIPGLEFREMEDSDSCCGSAGSFNLSHFDLSMRILDKKLIHIKDTEANLVVTSCPACTLQLSYGLRKIGQLQEVVHPVELLYRAYVRGKDNDQG